MKNLGVAVTAVINATFPDEDYAIAPDMNHLVGRAQLKEYDRVAKNFGFRDVSHLRSEVERRTSPRWAFFNIPFGFDIN